MALGVQRGGSFEEQILRYVKDTLAMLNRPGGQIFYVDSGAGNDGNLGTSYFCPVLTVTQALSLCTSGAGDIIQIIANSPSSPPGSETFPIAVNKSNVTIRGSLGYPGVMLSDSGIGCDEQNVATFEIGAHYVTIEDMYIGCDNLGTTGGIIEFNGTNSYFGVNIRRCSFDMQYVPAYGIKVDYDQPYLLVEDCMFGRSDIGGYTTAGIYIGNLTAGMIRRNIFRKCAGIGISAGLNAGGFDILDCRFNVPSDTVGKAITLAAGSSGIWVDGNRANFGMTGMTQNPYRDLNNDTSNTWGLNYQAGTSTMPIGT